MTPLNARRPEIWLAAGVRTPFAKVDGALAEPDAIALSVPVVQHMIELGGRGRALPLRAFTRPGAVAPARAEQTFVTAIL